MNKNNNTKSLTHEELSNVAGGAGVPAAPTAPAAPAVELAAPAVSAFHGTEKDNVTVCLFNCEEEKGKHPMCERTLL